MKTIEELLAFEPKTFKEARLNNRDLMVYRNYKGCDRVQEINDKLKLNCTFIKSISEEIEIIKDNEFKGKILVINTYHYAVITVLLILSAFILYKYY